MNIKIELNLSRIIWLLDSFLKGKLKIVFINE